MPAHSTSAQPPLERQLWAADHVVLAHAPATRAVNRYELREVIRGDRNRIQMREDGALDVDDGMWRLLGRKPAADQGVVLLLRGPGATPPAHTALELYLVDARGSLTHAPDDAAVKRELDVAGLKLLLAKPPFDTRSCLVASRHGDYLLCVERSGGGPLTGRLFRHGVELPGVRDGPVVETDARGDAPKFRWYGDNPPRSGAAAGWNYTDPARWL